MGCGQSKIHLYPRKSKSKANGKKSGHDTDTDADEEEGHIGNDEEGGNEKDINRDKDHRINEDDTSPSDEKGSPEANGEISVSLIRAKNLSLLQSQEISTSQQNFFKMLDQKIEDGPDYDSNSETEIALEEARLNALVQHWESASLTASLCSSASRSLQTTPVRQVPITTTAVSSLNRHPQPAGLIRATMNSLATLQQPLSTADILTHHNTQPPGMVLTQHQIIQQQQQQALVSGNGPPHMMMNVSSVMIPVSGSPQAQLIGKNSMNMSPKRIGDPRTMVITSQATGIHSSYAIGPQAVPLQMQAQQQQIMMMGAPMGLGTRPRPPNLISMGMVSGITQQQLQSQQQQQQQSQQQQQQQQQPQNQTSQPPGVMPTAMQISQYYGQPQPQTYFGEVLHPMQVPQAPPEYRFPPAISVQRLAPQVQRQLRETQELIKDSCPQLYAAGYGSPGPPLRSQPRNSRRPPTLETQYSTELS
ncbi:putative uncharacterized protein DDB_G0294196 isoform X2 [Condylostylus longicornis]|uniref:putative uncharacterized protein DDB_G0294196 isoform X2 n=1 Tax=Condylostylus longicornis TaxID=2530218 RepID=UPI00244E460D|nr:putative uncharacterized protein DDB_G0294196 isoform X2 [Condylostylus longicornis]